MIIKITNDRGLGLIELMVLLIVVSILIAVALQSMTATLSDFRRVKTEREMETLAIAIAGDPEKTAAGARTDFGYVGDIGSFPPDLDALKSNPGGYATWHGPYLPPDIIEDSLGFKTDEWGVSYAYSGGTTIQSNGSGSTLSKKIARSTADYLLNSLSGTIVDSLGTMPGGELDSVLLVVTIPNGTGSYSTKTYNPDSTGNFTLDSIPVGQHPLDIIYTPANDTLHRFIHILPRHRSSVQYKFASAWSGGGGGSVSAVEILRPVGPGSASDLSAENCSTNWQCVDESTSDGDATYVKGPGSGWNYDLYDTQDHSAGSGTIDSVILVVRAKGSGGGMKAMTYLRANGSNYPGSFNNTTGSYVAYSSVYTSNPNTSAAWTWTEIDAIEIGAGAKKAAFITQVWVEVYYTN